MHDEELPQPPPRSVRRTRLGWAVAVLVGIAVVVAAVVRFSSHSTPRAAAPTVTVTPSSSSTSSDTTTGTSPADAPPAVLSPLRQLTDVAIDDARSECPRLAPTCTTTGETPAAVMQALRSVYPGATHLVAVSDIAYRIDTGPRLTFRRLSARAGQLSIAVEVRQRSAGVGEASLIVDTGGQHVVRTTTTAGGLSVEVQVSAPGDRRPDPTRARRLAADPRLLATG